MGLVAVCTEIVAARFTDILYDDPEDYTVASHDAWGEPLDEQPMARRSFDPRILLPLLLLGLGLGAYMGWRTFSGPTSEVQAVTESLGSTASVGGQDGAGSDEVAAGGGDDADPQLPAPGEGDGSGGAESGDDTGGDDTAGDDTGGDDAAAGQPTTTLPSTTTTFTPSGSVIYYNDFSAGTLGPEWEQYDSIGNAGWGLRRPSAISIVPDAGAIAGGNCLAITAEMGTGAEAGQLVSGGLKLVGYAQTYGRYTVRLRVDDDPDRVTNGVSLLWPTDNIWPQGGEINIVENFYNRATRSPVESRLHWMRPDAQPPFDRADDELVQVDHAIDGTDWHTYTLEWRADSVTIAVDDGPARLLSTGNALIPQWDMDITFQLDAQDAPGTGQQPVLNGEVSMCVDFVQVERL